MPEKNDDPPPIANLRLAESAGGSATSSGGEPGNGAVGGPSLRRAALFALRGALCSLVPVPFLDEHLLDRTRRRLVRDAAKRHGLSLSEEDEERLALGEDRRRWGCSLGCIASFLVRFPLVLFRRVFRTVLFFLTARDTSNAASRIFHQSYLLDLGMPRLGTAAAEGATLDVATLRRALDRTWAEVDPQPIHQALRGALRGSWGLLRGSARALARRVRSLTGGASRRARVAAAAERVTSEDLDAAIPQGLLERLLSELSHEGVYLTHVSECFARHLVSKEEEEEELQALSPGDDP